MRLCVDGLAKDERTQVMRVLFATATVGGMTPGYTKVHDSTREQEKQTAKIKRTVGRLPSPAAGCGLQAASCRLRAAGCRLL